MHPIATGLIMAGIFLIGAICYPIMPVSSLPQIDFPTIQIEASLPGASPETMAGERLPSRSSRRYRASRASRK